MRNLLISTLVLGMCTQVLAQNVSSPYSILGIGDIDTKDHGRYFGSGNASLARRDPFFYNFSNPASLTSQFFKTVNFDIAMRGRVSTFFVPKSDTSTSPTKDFTIKRISLSLKISQRSGFAFGLRPYSSVNYKFSRNQSVASGATSYVRSTEGSGGINQYYLSYATELRKRFSVGITASWLSGSLQKTTNYYGTSMDFQIERKEIDFYYGGLFQAGVQYYPKPGKNWKHQFGLTGSLSTGLTGELTTEYFENEASLKKEIDGGRNFKLPVSLGFGYSAIRNNRLALSVEANFFDWKYQKVDYNNSFTYSSVRFSAGLDYSFNKDENKTLVEKGYLSLGASAENYYIRIQNKLLWDYSFSMGGGKVLSRNLALYGGLELGVKGSKAPDQIQEKYTQFNLGISIRDFWFGTKKFGRYD